MLIQLKPQHWTYFMKMYIYAALILEVVHGLYQVDRECIHKADSMVQTFLKHTRSSETTTSNESNTLCCKDCECNKNCAISTESCCFPELARKVVDESIETCTYAQTWLPGVGWHYKAYYMVDKNPQAGCADKTFSSQHTGQDCGEVMAADWGNIYPVSSVSNGKIYRNIHCAVCHGVTDGELWQAAIECSQADSLGIFSNTNITDAIQHGRCQIYFDYAGNIFDVNDRKCFSGEIINYCPKIFVGPENLSLTAETMVLYCKSGFFSPYIYEHVYANIFCLICNTDIKLDPVGCSRPPPTPCDSHRPNVITFRSFRAILVPTVNNAGRKEILNFACIDRKHDMVRHQCRPVLCQSGTVLVAGKCQYVTDLLFDSDFIVNIVLSPSSSLPMSEITVTGATTESTFLKHFNRAWGEDWIIKSVAISENVSHVETILLQLSHTSSNGIGLRTLEFLNQVKSNLVNITHWKMGSTYLKQLNTFGSEPISRSVIDLILNKISTAHSTMIQVKSKLSAIKTYKVVAKYLEKGRNRVSETPITIVLNKNSTISKLMYCEQIELNPDEFVMLDKKVVYIKHLDVLLFDGQFVTVPDTQGLLPHVRICLDDSGFSLKMNSSSGKTPIFSLEILWMCVCHIYILCLLATY